MTIREGRDELGRRITVDIPDPADHDHDNGLPVGALLAAGVATGTPTEVALDGETIGLAAVVPTGYKLEVAASALRAAREYAEQHAGSPVRTTGHVYVRDLASWSAYVLRHGADTTEVYADQQGPVVTALLNAPGRDVTGWGDHRVTLDLETTEEWRSWAAATGKWHTQEQFAELIEAQEPTIVEPPAATMLELAQTFEATKGVNFQGGVSLQSGQRQLTYVETVEGKAGQRGQIVIPKQVTLLVQPWRGVPVRVQVTGRFRYRLDAGSLRLALILDQVTEKLDEAWAAFTGDIEQSLNGSEAEGGAGRGFPVLQGPAPVYSGRTA